MSGADERPVAIQSAGSVTPRIWLALPRAVRVHGSPGRAKRVLGDAVRSGCVRRQPHPPGAGRAVRRMRHAHSHEDEFVFVLEGTPTLVTDAGETELQPGMCAGFAAGSDDAHHLVNRGTTDVVYLEIGSRNADDASRTIPTTTWPRATRRWAATATSTRTGSRTDGGVPCVFERGLTMSFMQALRTRWEQADSLVCVGLDPEPAKFPAQFARRPGRGVQLLPRDRRCHRRLRLQLQAADRPLRRARRGGRAGSA